MQIEDLHSSHASELAEYQGQLDQLRAKVGAGDTVYVECLFLLFYVPACAW
jgi:hypothetical protein